LSKKPGFDWLSEEGFPLLVSMRYYSPGFVASTLQKMMETGEASPEKAITVLGTEIDAENEQLFAIRMELYESDRSFLSGIHFVNLERTQPDHIIQVLNRVLGNADTYGAQHIYIDDKETRIYVGLETEEQPQSIISEDKIKAAFACKTNKAFEQAISELAVTFSEKKLLVESIKKLEINDYKKIKFVEKYTGMAINDSED
jgi:hypothetical protein